MGELLYPVQCIHTQFIEVINFIFLRFIELGRHVNFELDPLRSHFDEAHKNEIHLLYLHFVFTSFLFIICDFLFKSCK